SLSSSYVHIFPLIIASVPLPPLFPYTTLFRSKSGIIHVLTSQLTPQPMLKGGQRYLVLHDGGKEIVSFLAVTSKRRRGRRADNRDRKSTRLNSSHGSISYSVFCLKKKKSLKAD